MAIGPKIENIFLCISPRFMTPRFRKTQKSFFCHFIVHMSCLKSLNISRSPNAKIFLYMGHWSGGFGVIPIFHFFEILKNFSFLGPGDKKVSTHDNKTFDVVFFDPPFLTMEGWGKICLFRLCWIIWWPRWDTLILAGEKSYYSWQ